MIGYAHLPSPRPMNFLIWNCRGSTSPEFRMNFRALLDCHKPALVVLSETHRALHHTMPQEFHFSNVAVIPTEGQAGGIAILWRADQNVSEVGLILQNIHCMIK
ncbi:hypothetical protein HAX54_014170, partial [Datura stramonium]|nr:hypothetical protein [Datura stramonium]